MARVVKGKSELERAWQAINQAKTVEQLRQAQAVVLPLSFGLSMQETAQIIGCSVGWTSRLRNRFLTGDVLGDEQVPSRGGRRRQLMSEQQERDILRPFMDRARMGQAPDVAEIKVAFEGALGRPVALSTIYNLLRRHSWRQWMPAKQEEEGEEE